MGDEQIKEASWVASYVSGVSAYLYGTRYSQEQATEELDQIVEYIQSTHG
jgi:hypothetical protein